MELKSRNSLALVAVFSAAMTLLSPALAAESNSHPKVALVLGGGGTRGCAHVGVIRVLQQAGVPIDFIVGTSMGAAVGGLYAAGCTPDQIEKMILDRSMMKAFDTVPIKMRVALTPVFFVPRAIGHHSHEGLYGGGKFRRYLNKCAPSGCNITEFKLPFYAVATDLLAGKPVILKDGDLGTALQASCAVPFLRKPVEIDGKLLTDGGIVANLPVRQAQELGAEIVIAVDVNEPIKDLPDEYFRHLGSVSRRCSSLMLEKMDRGDAAAADVLIKPDTAGIYLLSRKMADARNGIAAGEKAARESLPKIQQVLTEHGVLAAKEPGVIQTVEYNPADNPAQQEGRF
jgi:NTE family protein